jgi:hypothetical protein
MAHTSGHNCSPTSGGRITVWGRSKLRVRASISWHFGASAGRADARRRDAGDAMTSSRSGNAADVRPPPRPKGLQLPGSANQNSWLVMIQLGIGAAAKCQIILARALRAVFACLPAPPAAFSCLRHCSLSGRKWGQSMSLPLAIFRIGSKFCFAGFRAGYRMADHVPK